LSGSTQRAVPTEIQATAVGLLHGHERRGSGHIGTFATLWALSNLGISATMWIAAEIAGVGVLVSYFTAPETRGRSLHEAVWL
jgi:MFS transporter, putative metabolite transport protein